METFKAGLRQETMSQGLNMSVFDPSPKSYKRLAQLYQDMVAL